MEKDYDYQIFTKFVVNIWYMDLQTRKLNIIEYLIGLTDEAVFNVIEKIINESKNKSVSKRFTQQKLIERAVKSNQDYQAGNIKDQNKLEAESKNW